MLSEAEKSDIRRHLGYGALNQGGFNDPLFLAEYYQFDQNSNYLEQRMDQLSPIDEAKLSGDAVALIAMVGQEPAIGNSYTVTISAATSFLPTPVVLGPITAVSGDDQISMASKLPTLVAANATLASKQVTAAGPFKPGMSRNSIVVPQVAFNAPELFTVAISFTGVMGVAILQQGAYLEPSAVVERRLPATDITKRGYIPILNYLESAIAGVSQRAHLARAEEFVKSNEYGERTQLYNYWRNQLSTFIGVQRRAGGNSYSNAFIL